MIPPGAIDLVGDYGAVADGSTDNLAAFTAAIAGSEWIYGARGSASAFLQLVSARAIDLMPHHRTMVSLVGRGADDCQPGDHVPDSQRAVGRNRDQRRHRTLAPMRELRACPNGVYDRIGDTMIRAVDNTQACLVTATVGPAGAWAIRVRKADGSTPGTASGSGAGSNSLRGATWFSNYATTVPIDGKIAAHADVIGALSAGTISGLEAYVVGVLGWASL